MKGGTAINMTIFNLPRLSVDIDMDFTPNYSKEDTEVPHKEITERLQRYMQEEEYLNAFECKEYKPELLFSDEMILNNIKNHPMAIWKMEQRS